MDEDFCDNELYDDIMEAYAEGFVPCYGGGGDDGKEEACRADKKPPVVSDFDSGDFPEDIPF